ncbi:MAG: PEP-CTERM sorting domain-containing protein [Tepidisphaeraceae bacterium]
MRREIVAGLLLGLGAWQLLPRSAGANIVGYSCSADSSISDLGYTWGKDSSGDNWLNITSAESAAPAQIDYTVTTDTANDPTLIIGNDVNNDTGFTWTGYDVTVSMNNPFTLSSALVSTPAGWSAIVSGPTLILGQYVGTIDYTAGTPIPDGNELDFQYTLSFSSFLSYSFTETVVPVPEPASLGLLALGAVALLGRRKRA